MEIEGAEGRAGMAALAVEDPDQFDLEAFTRLVDAELPAYARPVFIRLQQNLETTGTFKLVKTQLREQAYHPDQVEGDVVFVRPANGSAYQRLDESIYERLCQGTAGY